MLPALIGVRRLGNAGVPVAEAVQGEGTSVKCIAGMNVLETKIFRACGANFSIVPPGAVIFA